MRLLLVEDDAALGEGICDGLRREGYTLDWLQDGASALHALCHEEFDTAILDWACHARTASSCCGACAWPVRACRCWC